MTTSRWSLTRDSNFSNEIVAFLTNILVRNNASTLNSACSRVSAAVSHKTKFVPNSHSYLTSPARAHNIINKTSYREVMLLQRKVSYSLIIGIRNQSDDKSM